MIIQKNQGSGRFDVESCRSEQYTHVTAHHFAAVDQKENRLEVPQKNMTENVLNEQTDKIPFSCCQILCITIRDVLFQFDFFILQLT